MTKILISLGGTGVVLTSLYWLEAKGEVTLNHTAIKVCVGGVMAVMGVMFVKQLGGFM
ncbi:hypothetical protein [Halobacillus karajensis]|uniref:Uncharacterized protein n=1 Tax=Halobacillus karajensis TaxID=195088 RepID=A0A059NW79_9BACI|nr:hypothetical protein [Halobacillus karajensis]CDQ17929.1 hypothetical protein BN982_00169 [Halobacillus karajensis]CDQ22548.1 hypothetical protein BN983_00761 [Halobacillus karajensis]CDQ26030.1 hypothetical protein BN981_00241 [Halobacillus karajensis]